MKHGRSDYDQKLHEIPEDEPTFTIRGQDVVGWMAVEAYANLAETAGASNELVASAKLHAQRMKGWAQHHGKLPDLKT